MLRSNSRSGLARSGSTRSIGSNADSNAAKSAAAAAASALANAQKRNSTDISTGARANPAAGTLQRRGSTSSLRSNTTNTSTRPGQYSAVRQTGSRRLYGHATTAAATAATGTPVGARPATPSTQTPLRETMRSKPPQVGSSQRRTQNISSSASVRSFQSDLERINEDYNKTFAYAGQTSASAMKVAAPGSVRGRRADSVISSAMSDTSEALAPVDSVARKKASRVSFSDVDENEGRSRNPSPNPERRKSALKQSSTTPSKTNNAIGRGNPAEGLMPPPALIRRGSNSSLRSNTSATLGTTQILAAPLARGGSATAPPAEVKGEDGELSTIGESNSAYSDADEDFKASPAIKRQTVSSPDTSVDSKPTMQLTQQNLAAVSGNHARSADASPVKSAMKKTPSQNGSARFSRLETDSQLDVADNESDESDDSFAARRRAKKISGRKSMTTMRAEPSKSVQIAQPKTNGSQPVAGRQRSSSVSSRQSRTSQEPSRMVSLRQSSNDTQQRRQSLQPTRVVSTDSVPGVSRRTSMVSLRSVQPPLPPKSARRGSVAGSVAESVRSDAVTNHIAVMEIAQQRVQRMLHPDADDSTAPSTFADAPEKKKSSFERKRPSNLTRQHSSSSMIDRSFRTSLRPEPVAAETNTKHKRAASDDRAFTTTLRNKPRPEATQRSSSMVFTSNPTDTQSMPATPTKKGRRLSFAFMRGKDTPATDEAPPVPSLPPMRRYSSDSDDGRPVGRKEKANALSAGTLRSPSGPNVRPSGTRMQSDISYSKKTGKPKKFQALRKLFRIRD